MSQNDRLKTEIAQAIAQRIALDCCDWQTARASTLDDVRRSMGKIPADSMPSASEIESAVRQCFAIYEPEAHARVLAHKRLWAKRILEKLSSFDIYLTGAVLNGCANAESNICFALFTDDVKSVEVALMDAGIVFEVVDALGGPMPDPVECLGFLIRDRENRLTEGVRIDIYESCAKNCNPFKRAPDAYQQPWEASGRANLGKLLENVHFGD